MALGTGKRSPAGRGALVAALVEAGAAQALVAVVIGPAAADAPRVHLAAAIAFGLLGGLALALPPLPRPLRRSAPWLLPPLVIVPTLPLLLTPEAPWLVSVAPALATVWAARLLRSVLAPIDEEPEERPLARRLAALLARIAAAALFLCAGAALARGGGATPTLLQWIVGLIAGPTTVALAALTGGLLGSILGRDLAGTAAALASNHEHPQRPIRVTRDDRLGALQHGLEGLRLRLLDELARQEEALAHIREAEAARGAFITSLSREVQAASAAIDGELVRVAAGTAGTDLVAARAAFDGLAARVRELVDLALVETDALRLTIVAVDLRALVDEVLGAHQEAAARRGIQLRRSGAAELPRVPADAARLQQILGAVIGGAIEAAAPGPIQAELRVVDEVANVTVRARDREGAGAHLCAFLGDAGERGGPPARARDLEIARAIARAHGGDLRLESESEHLILTLSLPLHPPEEPGDAAPRPVTRTDDRPRRRLTPAGRAA